MKNIILKNGMFGAAIVSMFMIGVTYYMKNNPNFEPNFAIGFVSMILSYSFIVMGVIENRKVNYGIISFANAFKTGFFISLIISTIYVFVWLVIHHFYFPDFIEKYSEMVLKNTQPEDLIAKTTEMQQMKVWYQSPIMVILLTFMEILPLGIIVSIVGALVLKKK